MTRTDLGAPVAYLICGKVGSGKTTYATHLAAKTGATVFSIDAWMATLFVADIPASGKDAPIDFAWYAERVDRCEVMIWELCKQQIMQGRSVVLDLGFLRRGRRKRLIDWATVAGTNVEIHLLDVDVAIRRERVIARNRQRSATFSFAVTEEMFDFAETLFEPLDAAEMDRVAVATLDASPIESLA
jgi:predicted kinase